MFEEDFEKAAKQLETEYADNITASNGAKLLRNLATITKYRDQLIPVIATLMEKFRTFFIFSDNVSKLDILLKQIDSYDEGVRGIRNIWAEMKEADPSINWPTIPGFGPIYFDSWVHRIFKSFSNSMTLKLYAWSVYDTVRPRPVCYYALKDIYDTYQRVNFSQEI